MKNVPHPLDLDKVYACMSTRYEHIGQQHGIRAGGWGGLDGCLVAYQYASTSRRTPYESGWNIFELNVKGQSFWGEKTLEIDKHYHYCNEMGKVFSLQLFLGSAILKATTSVDRRNKKKKEERERDKGTPPPRTCIGASVLETAIHSLEINCTCTAIPRLHFNDHLADTIMVKKFVQRCQKGTV